MNVVFDTNVLISSTLWDKSVSQKLLFKLIDSDIKIYTSKEIIQEYSKVINRDFYYSQEEISRVTNTLLPLLTNISPIEKLNVIKEDPDDNKIIECAIASKSDYIITYDKHLLKLQKFRDIIIIKPEEALKIFKL
ncbi:MAG: putative toxin-antitoxin system toxin component, PIN family [Nanoarchaeota archaeon]|mgnify:CR=1 FL=1